jgi:hypothetical protein
MQNLKCKVQNFRFPNFTLSNQRKLIFSFFTFAFLLFTFSCSMPNLEQPECTESRGVVKEFYSYHFGNEMKFTPETLQPREKFLTTELTKLLRRFATESDPFTLTTNDAPKAFSVSGCKVIDANKAEVRVLLFWRDESRSEQKEIHAEVVNQNGKWLINNIYNDQSNLQNNLNH